MCKSADVHICKSPCEGERCLVSLQAPQKRCHAEVRFILAGLREAREGVLHFNTRCDGHERKDILDRMHCYYLRYFFTGLSVYTSPSADTSP